MSFKFHISNDIAAAKRTIAARAPLPTDDAASGYTAWSLWVDTSGASAEVYRCVDATVGSAVWVKTTLTIDELGTAATRNVPETGDAAATEVVLGGDTRMTDTRHPKAHTHDQLGWTKAALATSGAGDDELAVSFAARTFYSHALTKNVTFVDATNLPDNAIREVTVRFTGHATTDYTVTLHASWVRLNGIATFTVPATKVCEVALRARDDASQADVDVSYTITP